MTKIEVSADESTKMMGVLTHVQELFYRMSDFKDGPKAGKVTKDQFKQSKSLFSQRLRFGSG